MINFEKGSADGRYIGYRVMRYDPETGNAISGADSRQSTPLTAGASVVYGKGHFLTNTPEYAIDYYAVHDNNVLLKVEFNITDVLEGSLEDREVEISVSKSKLLGAKRLPTEEKNMKSFEEEYKRIMEMLAGDAYGGSDAGAPGLGNEDFYAPGDARVPKVIGAKKKKKKGKGKKGKCKKGGGTTEVEVEVPVMRRTFPKGT